MRAGPITALIAAAALVGLLTYGVSTSGSDTTLDEALARDERPAAPDRRLPVLGRDETGSLAEHRGTVVVLNFWASWCVPCRDEAPLLQRIHERIAERGGTVLGVTYNDASRDALAFVKEFGNSYPSLRDVEGELYRAYGNVGVPETFVIDRRGRIAAIFRGPVQRAPLERALAPVLAEPR